MSRKNRTYHNISYQSNNAKGLNLRIGFISLLMVICFVGIVIRLVFLQVIDHQYYRERARRNVENRNDIPAKRGTIYDRQGRILAEDILLYSIGIIKKRIKNERVLMNALSENLNIPSSTIQQKLHKVTNFVYIAHKVPPQIAEKLTDIKEPGLLLEKRFLRVYPFKNNGSHFIGFCDVYNSALGGIELQYNAYLKGKSGWSIYQRDALGNQIPDLDYTGEDPIDGFNVQLTIDMDYQVILDNELEEAVISAAATDGIATLMDPNTGEILAMANYPNFDPNHPNHYSARSLKNCSITDVFEPGSTFKIITLAAALECLQLRIDDDIYFCENGRYRIYNRFVTDYKKFGWLTPRRIFENSSNIGTIKIAEALEKETLYRYVRNFGFGMTTGIDLPGESGGILSSLKSFSRSTHRYMSIGYEVGVTPLQLLNAYAVLANKGRLLIPYIMRSILTQEGRILLEQKPEMIRNVLSLETTLVMSDVLKGVVKEGTGKEAFLPGLNIAGKTGTAQIYDVESGKYQSNKHLASFIGFFPIESPQFVLLVMIRQPKGNYYGGLVAAPAFRKMAKRIISLSPEKNLNFAKLTRQIGSEEHGIELRGDGNVIASISNFSEKQSKDQNIVNVNLSVENEVQMSHIRMPSLKGLSLKEALSTLAELNLSASIEGHGIVIKQQPQAGARVKENQVIRLVCNPS
jgi:cell division protein FtsI (penicillin-binding protein 3)